MSAEPWRPANGSEGLDFEDTYCANCKRLDFEGRCGIQDAAFLNDIDDPDYPKEWIEEDGIPRCTAFEVWSNDRQDT